MGLLSVILLPTILLLRELLHDDDDGAVVTAAVVVVWEVVVVFLGGKISSQPLKSVFIGAIEPIGFRDLRNSSILCWEFLNLIIENFF